MAAVITFNPFITTNAVGSFNISSLGYIQGTALDQPAVRNSLSGGVLAQSETIPMWGGVGISELIPGLTHTNQAHEMGGIIGRATTLTAQASGQLTGFSVFDQAYNAVNTPQSPVPLIGSGGMVNFYRFGSGARIAVKMDPSLVDLEGNLITSLVSWDFINQQLQPYVASTPTESVTSMTWSSTNGGQAAIVMAAPTVFGLGDTVNISGATNTGTGGNSAVNGSFVINTFTDTTHFTVAMPAAAGVIGTIAGTIVLNVGTGALNVRVLNVSVGNSMTVQYSSSTGFATWNRVGSAAIILI